MSIHRPRLNPAVAFLLGMAALCLAGPLQAGPERLERLYEQLRQADAREAAALSREIEREWRQSGSPAMDLLLKRGSDALEAGDTEAAIAHLTALTDHAPDFAEGWHQRARAFIAAGRLGPAVADLGRVLALEPRHYEALAALGGILAETGRTGLAIRAFREVLAIYPRHAEISRALGYLESRAGGKDL